MKHYIEDLIFRTSKIFFSKILKVVKNNQNIVLKTFLLLKNQKKIDFFGQKSNNNNNCRIFLGDFTWNHPKTTITSEPGVQFL